MVNQVMQKYYSRMAKEGLLNAFIYALGAGFGALLISAFVFWLTGFEYPWVGFIIMGVVASATMPLLYFAKFRPSKKTIARRVDELGLKERLLTMVELENNDSYIAQRQREDAISALSKINEDLLKIIISLTTKIAVVCVGVFAIAMNVVAILSSTGVLMSGKELWYHWFGVPPTEYEITYTINGEGQLIFEDGKILNTGETYTITVQEGKDSGEVYAVSANEWVFIEWLDGYQYPARTERNVDKKMTVTVVFAEISGSAGNANAMDMPNDLPPSDENGNSSMPSSGPPSSTAGGQYEPTNQIIDGGTYYGDEYEAAYDKIREELEKDNEILEEQKDITSGYLGGIKADAEEKEENK